jgi:hypothetical protein
MDYFWYLSCSARRVELIYRNIIFQKFIDFCTGDFFEFSHFRPKLEMQKLIDFANGIRPSKLVVQSICEVYLGISKVLPRVTESVSRAEGE